MKSLVNFGILASIVLITWSCGKDDAAYSSASAPAVTSPVATNVKCSAVAAGGTAIWWFSADRDYLISPVDLSVRDAGGNVIGTYNNDTKTISELNGTVLVQSLDLSLVPVMDVHCNVTYPNGQVIAAIDPDAASSAAAAITSSADVITSSSGTIPVIVLSSSSVAVIIPASSSQTVIIPSSSSVAKSSSSKAVSSSSKAVSSSSKASTSPTFTPVAGGASGSGWASRYWDSCKPNCAWSGKGGPIATTCRADGSTAAVYEKSFDDGGTAGTCMSQIPIVINDNLAYSYAATPAGGSDCGKCYLLTFTGTGKYSTDANQKKLKGKQMVVMASNIGGDVGSGQFDIMIPGGGVGIYNGCSKMGLSCSGAQYGGLLSDCETSSNYNASTYKSCLINKCNSAYANNAQAKEGCLFLANWMEAAGNPNLTYVQVNCPQELINNY